jgi:hypothetical protein
MNTYPTLTSGPGHRPSVAFGRLMFAAGVLGGVFPLALVCLAVPHLTGSRLHTRRGITLTPVQAFGQGLTYLGSALCVHAFCYRRYEHRPLVRWAVFVAGAVSFVAGLYLKYG